ncbi:MAG: hypothetical protein LBS14_00540 [Holosporaceae bacterium]|jgi:hypothetical protein|nr:hypothetical protein [Holosporaceae bacterium]
MHRADLRLHLENRTTRNNENEIEIKKSRTQRKRSLSDAERQEGLRTGVDYDFKNREAREKKKTRYQDKSGPRP